MGGEGARTMMLVYNLPRTDAVYQRFAGIDGSAYFIGGFGMTALAADNIVVVPIRSVSMEARMGAPIASGVTPKEASTSDCPSGVAPPWLPIAGRMKGCPPRRVTSSPSGGSATGSTRCRTAGLRKGRTDAAARSDVGRRREHRWFDRRN